MGSVFVNLAAFMAGGYLVEQKYAVAGILLFAVVSICGSLAVSWLQTLTRRLAQQTEDVVVVPQQAL